MISWETYTHWHRLVKNIGWENQNSGEQKVVKSDKCTGISQLLGGTCPGCPQSLHLCIYGISRACAHLFFRHVFHACMHFSNNRPVEFRRLVAVSDTQHRPTCTRCSCLVVCAIYVWRVYCRARLGVVFLTGHKICWVDNLNFGLYWLVCETINNNYHLLVPLCHERNKSVALGHAA